MMVVSVDQATAAAVDIPPVGDDYREGLTAIISVKLPNHHVNPVSALHPPAAVGKTIQ